MEAKAPVGLCWFLVVNFLGELILFCSEKALFIVEVRRVY